MGEFLKRACQIKGFEPGFSSVTSLVYNPADRFTLIVFEKSGNWDFYPLRATQTPSRKSFPFGSALRPKDLSRGPLKALRFYRSVGSPKNGRTAIKRLKPGGNQNEYLQIKGNNGINPQTRRNTN